MKPTWECALCEDAKVFRFALGYGVLGCCGTTVSVKKGSVNVHVLPLGSFSPLFVVVSMDQRLPVLIAVPMDEYRPGLGPCPPQGCV